VPAAPGSADQLASAVRDALGDALGSDVQLRIWDADAAWEATLITASCSESGRIGTLPAERDEAVRIAADVVVAMASARDGCVRRDAGMRSERALLLSDALQPYTRGRYVAGMSVLTGLTAASVGMSLWLDAHAPGVGPKLMIAGTTTALASSIVTLAKPESAAATTLGMAGYAFGMGTTLVGLAYLPAADELGQPRERFVATYALIGAGYIASALWMSVDYFNDPTVAPAELFEARARLRTPSLRARVTDAELARYEQVFRRSQLRKRYFLPPLVAGLGAVVYASQLESSEEQKLQLVLAGTNAALFSLGLLLPDPVTRYTRKLREAGLDLQITPVNAGSGLAVSGRF
jgi:hypothetical protein